MSSGVSRRSFMRAVGATGVAGALVGRGLPAGAQGSASIIEENQLPGQSAFPVRYHTSIEGFTTSPSVNVGEEVAFKINTDATAYRVDIYRVGWYGGEGSRLVTSITPSGPLPQLQPDPVEDPGSGLVDCGNWAVSLTWDVPATALSGVYIALLVREDTGAENNIVFVVRDDARSSDILFQTSDTTMQAYNRWGGNSLYYRDIGGRATKVSYNRPQRHAGLENTFANAELPMVRWLERNGYDVTYASGVDVHARPDLLDNKNLYLSVGHDEYVSGAQRANIEQALATGTHLGFFSGNEMFWKIRFEDSIDGSGTPNRTMVCFKETLDGAKTDPTASWTGTWRDGRFSPPSDGGRPENGLIGQLFKVINNLTEPDEPMHVPAQYGRLRFWRNTDIAQLASGQVATLPVGILGYEWDVDEDNGHRPPGLMRLSGTTLESDAVLQDEGGTYVAEPATHNMTLYRHPGGGLVFGAGTVQWSWGLDDLHVRGEGVPTDSRAQQATVNLFADMGVQPGLLQPGLVSASPSTDVVPPTTSIDALPDTVRVGQTVRVSGTSSDIDGEVAAVEARWDGDSWHPVGQTSDWAFEWTPTDPGPAVIEVRAADDSGNLEDPPVQYSVDVGDRQLPASIWGDDAIPSIIDGGGGPIEVGVRFKPDIDGFIVGLRFFKSAGNTGPHIGHLWTAEGELLATAEFGDGPNEGWQQVSLPEQIAVVADTTYVASYFAPAGGYSATANGLSDGAGLHPIRALADGVDGANGLYRTRSSGFPTRTYEAANYWVDVVFDDRDRRPPQVAATVPADGEVGVTADSIVQVRFNEPMDGASIDMSLVDELGEPVAGSTSYDEERYVGSFVPDNPLRADGAYTAVLADAADATGNQIEAPTQWSFGVAPSWHRTLWPSSTLPATPATGDTSAVELGIRFTAQTAGVVRAIRFYADAANAGPHVVKLWTADGVLLAGATQTSRTQGGWQQVELDQPIRVTPGDPYIASYHAPVGRYPFDGNFFRSSSHDSGQLTAPKHEPSRPNGCYVYGPSGFPHKGAGSNYWVDVVLDDRDTAGPSVTLTEPSDGAVDIAVNSGLRVRFDEPVVESSVNIELRPDGGSPVAGTLSYDEASRTAEFQPSSPLAADTSHVASLLSANDPTGNPCEPRTWQFRTVAAEVATLWPSTTIPAVAAADDSGAVELGVRVVTSTACSVRGIRFYKGPGNDGPHVANLWTPTGTLLATAAYVDETVQGWQSAYFDQPVAIQAGAEFVASYHAPVGHYAFTGNYFRTADHVQAPLTAPRSRWNAYNGVFSYGPGGFPTRGSTRGTNYWVDVIIDV